MHSEPEVESNCDLPQMQGPAHDHTHEHTQPLQTMAKETVAMSPWRGSPHKSLTDRSRQLNADRIQEPGSNSG